MIIIVKIYGYLNFEILNHLILIEILLLQILIILGYLSSNIIYI